MSDRSALIPTAVAGGYGAAPHAAPKKGKAVGASVRVLAAVAGVAACGVQLFAEAIGDLLGNRRRFSRIGGLEPIREIGGFRLHVVGFSGLHIIHGAIIPARRRVPT